MQAEAAANQLFCIDVSGAIPIKEGKEQGGLPNVDVKLLEITLHFGSPQMLLPLLPAHSAGVVDVAVHKELAHLLAQHRLLIFGSGGNGSFYKQSRDDVKQGEDGEDDVAEEERGEPRRAVLRERFHGLGPVYTLRDGLKEGEHRNDHRSIPPAQLGLTLPLRFAFRKMVHSCGYHNVCQENTKGVGDDSHQNDHPYQRLQGRGDGDEQRPQLPHEGQDASEAKHPEKPNDPKVS
mmetsp:Transcript_65911/g.137623  ORF Transcript_65911/g.137623 Transcript_65911/m.137623 type:complete len:235 (+) Transcript_65911:727-1431(+)